MCGEVGCVEDDCYMHKACRCSVNMCVHVCMCVYCCVLQGVYMYVCVCISVLCKECICIYVCVCVYLCCARSVLGDIVLSGQATL